MHFWNVCIWPVAYMTDGFSSKIKLTKVLKIAVNFRQIPSNVENVENIPEFLTVDSFKRLSDVKN